MKKSIITITVVLMTLVAVAGTNNYKNLMKENLVTLRVYDGDKDFKELGDKFADIAENNSKKFEPLYYSAYCYIIQSWQIKEPVKKTEVLNLALSQIDKALKLAPDNDELLVLKAFYYQAMIMINPQKYGQSYSTKAGELLNIAQKINPSNPRAQFLLAQNIYYRPVQYGGGKEIALPMFKKAAKLFKQQNTDNYLLPIWGEKTNGEMIAQCKK